MKIRDANKDKILVLSVLLITPIVLISLIYPPRGANISAISSICESESPSEEYLLIKIVLHPNLSKYLETGGTSYGTVTNIGNFIKVDCVFRDKVTLTVGDKRLCEFSFDELRGVTRNITSTVYGCPITVLITVRTLNISMFSQEFPQKIAYLKDKILKIVEESDFIRLIKSLGMKYYIVRVFPSKSLFLKEPKMIIEGALVIMKIRAGWHELEARCLVKLKVPYELYINGMPKEFLTDFPSPTNYLVVRFIGGEKGRSIVIVGPTRYSSSRHRMLNVSKELKSEIMKIVNKNEIVSKLLNSGAEIEQVFASEHKTPLGVWRRYITLKLVWPEFRRLEVEVDIIDSAVKRIETTIRESVSQGSSTRT